MDDMVKNARIHAVNPEQEHLREHKAEWNSHVSKFISTLIALKRAINGYPVPVLGLQKNKITEPVPSVVNQLLEHLADEYMTITNDGKSIVQEQDEYTEHRTPKVAMAEIEIMASNLFSRLWSYVKLPFQFSDKDRWIRKDLLLAAADVEGLLKQIEDNILTQDPAAIPNAVFKSKNIYYKIENDFIRVISELLAREALPKSTNEIITIPLTEEIFNRYMLGMVKEKSFDEFKSTHHEADIAAFRKTDKGIEFVETRRSEPKVDIEEQQPEIVQEPLLTHLQIRESIKAWVNEIAQVNVEISTIEDKEKRMELRKIINNLNNEISKLLDALNKGEELDKIQARYNNISEEINKLRLKDQAAINSELVALAQTAAHRWFKRKWYSLFRNRDKSLRLRASDLLINVRKYLNEMMNALEDSSPNINIIRAKLLQVCASLGEFFDVLNNLGEIHNSNLRMTKLHSKKIQEQPIPVKDLADLRKMSFAWKKHG